MTDWNSNRTLQHRDTALAFAVGLTDPFTGDRPSADEVSVSLASEPVSPVRNPSGFYVFVNLDVDEVTVLVDGGDRFRDERRTVVLPSSTEADRDAAGIDPDGGDDPETVVVTDPSDPVLIELTPTPAYRFPDSTTVIRGHVETADGTPVAGASVSLREFDPVVRTTETGEFALWVPATGEDVQRRDGRNVVVVGGTADNGGALADGDGTDPTLVVDLPDGGEISEQVEVRGGTKTVQYVTVEE